MHVDLVISSVVLQTAHTIDKNNNKNKVKRCQITQAELGWLETTLGCAMKTWLLGLKEGGDRAESPRPPTSLTQYLCICIDAVLVCDHA